MTIELGVPLVVFDKKLSVIMPCYNEATIIYENLLKTAQIISSFAKNFEIIAVNDGSDDETFLYIQQAARADRHIKPISSTENMGKGYALKLGIEVATGEYIAFIDSDLDLSPDQLQNLFSVMHAQNADVVIGSKLHKNSEIDYPLRWRIVSRIYYFGILMLFHLNVHDTQTGIKLFKAEIIKPVMKNILVKRFACDIEILVNCRRKGAKIVECPIRLVFGRGTTFGRIQWSDIWCTGWDTMAIFYRLYILRYYDKSEAIDGNK